MGRYNQLYHDDSKHLTTAKRDTVNGVCGIDASKEIINDVPVSKLVNMNTQSFDSLLDNGDFKDWSAGDSSAPDNWSYAQSGAGGGVARSSTHKIGTYSAEITKSDSGNSIISTTISDYSRYAGVIITLGCWIKSVNTVTDQIKLQIYDGVDSSNVYYQNTGDWEFLTLTHTVNSSPTQLKSNLIVITGSDAVAYFDGTILVEGPVCPAFSPKPVSHIGWVSIAPFLDENTANVANKPSLMCRGLFCGYSLPEYAAGEELLFRMRVPHSWDGTTNPWFVAITSISATEDIGDKYKLQLEYEAEDILHVIPDTTAETLTDEITVADGTAFYSEIASFELDASNLVAGQNLQGRLRRIAASASSVSNEIIVWHWDTRWKYNKIGTESIQGY